MPRIKERAARRARREKPQIANKDTYTTDELRARYDCSQVTLRRKEREQGFPHGEKIGRGLVYGKAAVHAWEREHMPSLHVTPEMSEEDKVWDRMRRQRELEREESAAGPAPPDNKKPKRHDRAERRMSP